MTSLTGVTYAKRNVDGILLIKINHNFFKNTFFPSAIIEQNKLDSTIKNAESFCICKSNNLKLIRPTQELFMTVTTVKELDYLHHFA